MENGVNHPDVELTLSVVCHGSIFACNVYAWPDERIAQANVQEFPRPRESLALIQHGRARLHRRRARRSNMHRASKEAVIGAPRRTELALPIPADAHDA
jgi:hypothetical protein